MYHNLMLEYKKKIGEGSFSRVYEAEDVKGKKYAVKIEKKTNSHLLENEAKIHFYLFKKDVGKKYVVPIYDFYSDKTHSYMIMEKLFISLADILKVDTIDDFSIRNIAIKLIQNLKFMHKHGVCHCDIKPDNIMMTEDYANTYLIDYGLSRYYIIGGKHIKYSNNVNNGGTLRFMSFHTNDDEEISRRDDLISLGYVLVYLQKKNLPWQDILIKQRVKKVAHLKKTADLEELCKGCVPELLDYLKYCYKLDFDEKPDYYYLMNLFTNETAKAA